MKTGQISFDKTGPAAPIRSPDPERRMDRVARILYETPRLRVVYQPADSNLLVFSFNGVDYAGRGRSFFGDRFFAKRGLSAIGIVDNNRSWYPHSEMLEAVQAIDAAIPAGAYARRLAYGVSMGGYAALKYADRLASDATLVFGPQWSIDPKLVGPFDARYADFYISGVHTGVRIDADELCPRNYVIYDPLIAPDKKHVEILSGSPTVHPVIGTFLGHPGIAFFAKARVLERALRFAAEEARPDPLAVRRLIRRTREASPEYWRGRANCLHRKRGLGDFDRIIQSYLRAERLNEESSERSESLDAIIGIAELLLDARRPEEAKAYLEILWSRGGTSTYNRDLVNLFLRANTPWRAQKVAAIALEREPRNPGIRLDLVKALIAAGEATRANSEIDIAREYAGPRPRIWKRLSWLYGQLGRKRESVAALDAIKAIMSDRVEAGVAAYAGQPASSKLN